MLDVVWGLENNVWRRAQPLVSLKVLVVDMLVGYVEASTIDGERQDLGGR